MPFERRELGSIRVLVASALDEVGALAAFTERTGGRSDGPFSSLNASLTVGDEAQAVAANRRAIVDGLQVAPFALAGLVHRGTIARIGPRRAGSGFDAPDQVVADVDGLTTATRGVPMAVTTADCVPLVFASAREPSVTVVHAGWRGFAAGIVAAALSGYEEPEAVRVAIGPAIGPCHYEVGEDVALAVAAGSDAGAVTERTSEGALRLDLVATAKEILGQAGAGLVEDTGLCTACEADRFFSHRRDGVTGRQLALAARLRG